LKGISIPLLFKNSKIFSFSIEKESYI